MAAELTSISCVVRILRVEGKGMAEKISEVATANHYYDIAHKFTTKATMTGAKIPMELGECTAFPAS